MANSSTLYPSHHDFKNLKLFHRLFPTHRFESAFSSKLSATNTTISSLCFEDVNESVVFWKKSQLPNRIRFVDIDETKESRLYQPFLFERGRCRALRDLSCRRRKWGSFTRWGPSAMEKMKHKSKESKNKSRKELHSNAWQSVASYGRNYPCFGKVLAGHFPKATEDVD